MHKLLP